MENSYIVIENDVALRDIALGMIDYARAVPPDWDKMNESIDWTTADGHKTRVPALWPYSKFITFDCKSPIQVIATFLRNGIFQISITDNAKNPLTRDVIDRILLAFFPNRHYSESGLPAPPNMYIAFLSAGKDF